MNDFLKRRLPDFILLIYVIAVTLGAFVGGVWASLGLGASLFLFFFVWHLNQKSPAPERGFIRMAFATLLIMGCLNLNSTWPGTSWQEWIKLATIFLPLCFLLSPSVTVRIYHPKFFTILPIAMIIGGLALAIELYFKAPMLHTLRGPDALIAGYNRGLSYLVMIAFPVMTALWSSPKRWWVVGFFLLILIPTSLSESRTAKLALMLAVPIIIVAQFWPVLVRRILAVTPFVTIGWPFAAQRLFATHYEMLAKLPDSWRARVEIWDYMSYRIMEHPLLGWGLGTSRQLPFAEPHGTQYIFTVQPAGHPHNVMTQLWVELGVPGLALGIVFALLVLHKISRLDARLVPFAMGAWVAGFCFCLIAYNFWTDSLFACFAMTGVAFTMLERKLKLPQSFADAPEVH